MKNWFAILAILIPLLSMSQTSPQTVMNGSAPYSVYSQRQLEQANTYLLGVIAMGSTVLPSQVMTGAVAYASFSDRALQQAQTYLLANLGFPGNGQIIVISTNGSKNASTSLTNAVQNASYGDMVMLGPGDYTNLTKLGVPNGVGIVGAGRNLSRIWYSGPTIGFSTHQGWLMVSNSTYLSRFQIGRGVPVMVSAVPLIIEAGATNIVMSEVGVYGDTDVGVWNNTGNCDAFNCYFQTFWDGWTDAGTAGGGAIRFLDCIWVAAGRSDALALGGNHLDFVQFSVAGSSNCVVIGGSATVTNLLVGQTPSSLFSAGGTGSNIPMLGGVFFQNINDNNAEPGNLFWVANWRVLGHPYDEPYTSGVIFDGDATNAPISGAFLQSSSASGIRRWAPNTNSPGPFTIANGAAIGYITNAPATGNATITWDASKDYSMVSTSVAVTVNITGLQAGQVFHSTLVLSNQSGTARAVTGGGFSMMTNALVAPASAINMTNNDTKHQRLVLKADGVAGVITNVWAYQVFDP